MCRYMLFFIKLSGDRDYRPNIRINSKIITRVVIDISPPGEKQKSRNVPKNL